MWVGSVKSMGEDENSTRGAAAAMARMAASASSAGMCSTTSMQVTRS